MAQVLFVAQIEKSGDELVLRIAFGDEAGNGIIARVPRSSRQAIADKLVKYLNQWVREEDQEQPATPLPK